MSIVIPSFNQAAFLDACLESVLAQRTDGVETEVIVYDGGSVDGSREIIERRASRLAYWVSRTDGGQAAAIQAGFERATGEILGWVNSDDLLLPGAVLRMARWFDEHAPSVLAYGDAVWIDAKGRVLRPKRELDFDWGSFAYGYCHLPQPSTFFRRAAYLQAGGVDPSLHCCLDYDLWHRVARLGPVGHVRAFLSALRVHPGTKTSRLRKVFAREHEILRRRYLGCTRAEYMARHAYQRTRRVVKKILAGAYAPLSANEAASCALPR